MPIPGVLEPWQCNGTTIYTGDPKFVDPAGDDYHIKDTSPVIDKDVDTWTSIDMDGLPRTPGSTDFGADEYRLNYTIDLPLVLE